MQYFMIIMITVISFSSFTIFLQNNNILKENKDAYLFFNNVKVISEIPTSEKNLSLKYNLTSMSNYILDRKSLTYKNITLLNKLEKAMLKALNNKENPNCTDLANTKEISLVECEEISKKEFDLLDISNESFIILSNNLNKNYIIKAKNILEQYDISKNQNNLILNPSHKNYLEKKLKQEHLNKLKLVNIKALLEKDFSGELAIYLVNQVVSKKETFYEQVSELALKKYIELEYTLYKNREKTLYKNYTGVEDYNLINTEKMQAFRNEYNLKLEELFTLIINNNKFISKDISELYKQRYNKDILSNKVEVIEYTFNNEYVKNIENKIIQKNKRIQSLKSQKDSLKLTLNEIADEKYIAKSKIQIEINDIKRLLEYEQKKLENYKKIIEG